MVVQNILHGLSPGLSDAINSISRWSFIKASLPHIMHACTAALIYRRERLASSPPPILSSNLTTNAAAIAAAQARQKLGKTETKLLYTLHWLLLDAAAEYFSDYTYFYKNSLILVF